MYLKFLTFSDKVLNKKIRYFLSLSLSFFIQSIVRKLKLEYIINLQ